ncbi:MAG TPA: phytanoyl-CoA dioxygenase family protein [Abditibacteriaceae bacterium]|jgi:ectoine hydroxylase-related dioxygenase (phytanoyl-CoA dioxygenase family)|nr:phytanoyl-CoA dioxygenase family protein [Abditibacteriaceae bacterium]
MSISTSRLNQEQIAQYERDGYTLFQQPVFSPLRFAQLKTIFEEDLLRYGDADLDTIHFRDERLLDFLLDDAVLDLVEPLVGPNIGLWSSHFISKEPFKGKATPWHEDSSYWNGRVSTMEKICTVWLAMDEATPENGCMKVIPGSQQGGFSDYEAVSSEQNIFPTQIKPELINESKAVYFSLQPNQCSLHEARIIHGADANTSPRRRAGYTMRYFPTSSLVYPEKMNGHKLWLARGVDVAGNHFENA